MIETEFKFKAKLRRKDVKRVLMIVKIVAAVIIAMLGAYMTFL